MTNKLARAFLLAISSSTMSRSRHARAPTHKNSKQQLGQTPKRTARQASARMAMG